jgi:dihydrofolate reductase
MDLILIAAVSENNIIGKDGKIPWHIPEEIKHFKDLTLEHPVIMGRKTYESIQDKFRPLVKRKNIVLSKNFRSNEEIYLARNIEEALELAENKDTYIIGGEKIYNLFLPFINKIELTRIHRFYDGDSFFPVLNWEEWNLINEERNTSKNGIEYSFLSYDRKDN